MYVKNVINLVQQFVIEVSQKNLTLTFLLFLYPSVLYFTLEKKNIFVNKILLQNDIK